MQLDLIIQELRARCPSFAGRVAGAAEFKPLPEAAHLPLPAAYVLPMDDAPEQNRSQTGYLQTVRDGFAVVVALSNAADERGQAASYNAVHALRAEIFRGLLGWTPSADYGPIEYEGGGLLRLDRAVLYYQFEFAAEFELQTSDTRQGADLDALPAFTEAQINVDAIDPMADPNLSYPGPDGRIEQQITIKPPQ